MTVQFFMTTVRRIGCLFSVVGLATGAQCSNNAFNQDETQGHSKVASLVKKFESEKEETWDCHEENLLFVLPHNDFGSYTVIPPRSPLVATPPALPIIQNWLVRRTSFSETFIHQNLEFSPLDSHPWGPRTRASLMKGVEPTLYEVQIMSTRHGDPMLTLIYDVKTTDEETGECKSFMPLLYTKNGVPNMLGYEFKDPHTGEVNKVEYLYQRGDDVVSLYAPQDFRVLFDERYYSVKTNQFYAY
jgi:hypothetical protein